MVVRRPSRTVIRPDDGEHVTMSTGIEVVYRISADDTGGAFAVVEHPVPPGAFVPPDTHRNEDELSYLVAGRIAAYVGGEVHELSAGSYLLKPRGVPHAFWNPADEPALMLELIWPPAMADAYREMARAEQRPGGPDREELMAIARRYGVLPNRELLPELEERYGVRAPDAYRRMADH